MITKTERTELARVVRQQFKVLRAEVDQRRAELYAEMDAEIAKRHSGSDAALEQVAHVAQEAEREANRRINDAIRQLFAGDANPIPDGYDGIFVRFDEGALKGRFARALPKQVDRQAMTQEIEARVRGASTRLARQEADLLRQLAEGAIEGDEARAFLAAIPTIGELIPADRMPEIGQ